ncbi:MAG TPA: septal ring lytic transglycosylase RlpA family protein [Solirubrobacterales bacterium]|nr:septal ring lytic transglycosylase RlpA family protein [Solirubrobacterales bacterium]
MKTVANRLWRQDHLRFVRADGKRAQLPVRWAVPLLIAAAFALAAAPAQAETGGASTVASSEAQTGSEIAFMPMRWAAATWYGPGFYGSRTACGQVLRPHTIGVAHRNLPCGTTVKFVYHGQQIVTTVIDRGPYSRGNSWDLTNGARQLLGFDGSGPLRYAVSLEYARQGRRLGHAGR